MEINDQAKVESIMTDWRSAPLTEREHALCLYAAKLTATPAAMNRNDLTPLREVGLSDESLLDLVQVIGYFNYINRVADALGVPAEDNWKN